MTHDTNLDTNLRDILVRIGKELHSDPKNNTNYMQHIEELKQYLQNNKGIAVNKELFKLAILKPINVWETKVSQEAIYYLLSYYIENNNIKFQDVINCLKDAMKDKKYLHDSNLHKLLNYPDEDGISLLHKAVLENNTDAIEILLANDVNSLAISKDNKTPFTLDGISFSAKSALINGMKEQAKRYKENTLVNSSIAFATGFFSTVGLGTAMCLVLGNGASSCRTAVAIGMSLALLVGGVALLAVYSFSPDYKQAKAIDRVLFSKEASLESTETTHVGDNKNRIV
ncbi:MAG TPA: hypothetical protein DEQ74_02385 [Wolbachia sp.]|jgi:hypothetical protein|uniref:ankyrin repeat domain-containing protein n=1 Tax=Wolbachia endosymbiont of Pentalonia nigronervosa TaxID=1301914 RepID=UPI000EC8D501|nr:ankyrin repeat domain-containing protein [Wolbachia endosymbiont of Pentalonia nigronervosa]MBD0390885.1 ankyrin repeat domain-containing protein [Wolbachia endosymbiont of Pentalonia nigronervosa]HCE59655.1 hypothetical protein [Wolbachia sp.]